MNALALGPLLIALPQLYAFTAAVVVLLASMALLPPEQCARWFNGLLLTSVLGARLGYVLGHIDAYQASPIATLKLWQPGYLPFAGWLAAALWTLWSLRGQQHSRRLAQGLLAVGAGIWLSLMAWQPGGRPLAPERLPTVTLQDLVGNRVALAELTDKPLVVNLWASECPACRRELPLIAAADARNDIEVVIIDQGESLLEVGRYLDQQAHTMPLTLLDPHQTFTALSRTPGLPTTLLFDGDGRLLARQIGELGRGQLSDWLAR